jgi:hypothetical protein
VGAGRFASAGSASPGYAARSSAGPGSGCLPGTRCDGPALVCEVTFCGLMRPCSRPRLPPKPVAERDRRSDGRRAQSRYAWRRGLRDQLDELRVGRLCGPCRDACRRSPSGALVRVGIWLARRDWVLLAAAAESDCRLVIWLAPVHLIVGFRRACHRMAVAAVRRALTCCWGVGVGWRARPG